jgi:hypothetical protein
MSEQSIIDGAGKGYGAKVDSLNRLNTFSITEAEARFLSKSSKVWSAYFSLTPTGANDYFFYIKNTGADKLLITNFRVSSTAVTRLTYEKVTGTAAGGTTLTPTNRDFASSNSPAATIESGVDITGLTTGGIVLYTELDTAGKLFHTHSDSGLILAQGQAFAIKRTAATGAVTGTVTLAQLT